MTTPIHISSQEMIGNPVISVTNGEMIAKVEDVQIDPNTLEAAAAVTSKGGLLSHDIEAIPADRVELWGRDAMLAKGSDVIVKEEELDSQHGWLSVSDDIRGHEVFTEDGTRVGEVSDLALDSQGRVKGYKMAGVAIESRVAVANWIDVKATRSLGPDVLIVKSEYL